MIGCKITIWLSYILELTGCWVQYLYIASYIFVAVEFTELINSLVRNVGKVKLMVAYKSVSLQLVMSVEIGWQYQ